MPVPTYTFRNLPAGYPVMVYPVLAGVRGAPVSSGVINGDGVFSASLPTGAYLAEALTGRYARTAGGEPSGGLSAGPGFAVQVDAVGSPYIDTGA